MRSFFVIIATQFLAARCQISILEEIQKLYLQQGIPFRENTFLDNLPILAEYDFVVVGSGPAGSVLANRLTEVDDWQVLLIEAGLEGNIYNDIPFVNPMTILGNFSKFYEVEKTKNACTGLINKQCLWPAGEALGGATVINGMMYTRGHPSDFDEWAAEGNVGWAYNDVLPYFLKSERMTISNLRASKYHSTQGPLNIDYPYMTKITERFLKAGKQLGYNVVDYNNPKTMLGFSQTQVTMKSGKRQSAASAYLMPIKSRHNLHVVKGSPVTKIIIDPKTNVAKGVKFLRKGKQRQVMVRREVILSAGAFNSPKLLMLSGIGHKEHLESMKIPIIKDLPVGDNLQEHLGSPIVNFLINNTESVTFQKVLMNSPMSFLQWLSGRGGLFSSNGAEALGYIKSPLATDNKADVELICIPISPGADGGMVFRRSLSVSDETYIKGWRKINFREGFTISPVVMYPKSRGTVRLRSRYFEDPPVIDGNFFAHPYDVRMIIEGVRVAVKLTQTKPFREIGTTLYAPTVPGCEKYKFNSDEFWDCAIRAIPIQFHHQCGTCRMGPDQRNSVVDPRLRVHGVKRLRVADASVMPRMPGPHTMAACYMIGEKAADLIKEDWGVVPSLNGSRTL